MSTSIDNHVVRMEFENKSFEKNASQTLDTVDKLKENLKFDGASKGLESLSAAVKNVDTSGLSKGAEEAQSKFSALGVIGATALFRLTNAAIDVGKKIASALTSPLNQIKSGGWSRAMNLEQAKFQLKGLKMDVEAVMKDVDYAVSGTAYSLDAAAKAAATLGASGVKAGDQVGGLAHALRAVSGVAAMTNSDYESIAQIFGTVAGNGKLMTMQLRQLSTRGMNAAAVLAQQMGVSEQAINQLVHDGKISFQEFSEAMYEAFGEHAVAANETFQGALSNIKSALSRVGETFATPIIQQAIPVFNAIRTSINAINTEVKSLWGNSTKFGRAISGPFEQLAKAVSKSLTAYFNSDNFIEAGKSIVRGISNIFLTILDLIDAVRSAWLDIFPSEGPASGTRKAAEGFESLTQILRNFVNVIIPPLKEGLKIIFSILKVVVTAVKSLFSALQPVFRLAAGIIAIIANVARYLGSLVVSALETVDVGKIIAAVFNVVKHILELAAAAVLYLVYALYKLNEQFPIFTHIGNGLKFLAGIVGSVVGWIYELLTTPLDQWGNKFSAIVDKIKQMLSAFMEIPIVNTIITKLGSAIEFLGGLLAKAVSAVKNYTLSVINFFSEMIGAFKEKGIGGVVDFIIKKFTELKNTVSGFVKKGLDFLFGGDTQSKASGFLGVLGNIVTKIRELASNIDMGTIAVTAFTGAFIALIVGVAKSAFAIAGLFRSLTGVAAAIKGIFTGAIRQDRPIVSAAKAIFLFSAALLALSYVDIDKLPKIAAALTGVVLAMAGMSILMGLVGRLKGVQAGLRAMTANMLAMSISVGILSASLIALTYALKDQSWENIGKALASMLALAAGLGVIVTLISRFAPQMFKGSLSLLLFAISINLVIKRLESINVSGIEDFSNGLALGLAALGTLMVLTAPVIKGLSDAAKGIGVAAAGIAIAVALLAHTADFIQSRNWDEGGLKKALAFIGILIILFGAIALANTYITAKNTKVGGKNDKFSKSSGVVGMIISLTAAVVLLSGLAVLIAKVPTDQLVKGLLTVGSVVVLLGVVVTAINKSAKDVDKSAAITIGAVVVSIVILIGEMIALTFVPWDKLLKAILALTGVMIAFGVAVKATMKYGQNANAKGIINFIAVLGSMVVVAEIMIKLSEYNLDWKQIAAIGGSMAATMVAFGAAINIISKSGNSDGAAAFKALIPVLVSMLAIAGIMIALSTLGVDWKTIAATGAAMSLAMVAFGGACKLISGFEIDRGELVNLLGIVGLMMLIGLELSFLAQFDWDKLIVASVSLSLTMVAFGAACKLISGFEIDKSQLMMMLVSMGVLTLVLLAIAAISKIFDGVSWESLLKGGASLLVLGAFIVGFSMLMKSADIATLFTSVTSLIIVVGALALLGFTLQLFEDISWDSIAKGALSLVALAGALTLMCLVGGGGVGMLLSAAALAVMGVSLGVIALALKQFDTVSWESLGKAALVLIALGAAILVLSVSTVGGLGAIMVAAGLVILAAALILLAPAIDGLAAIGGGTILGTLAGLGAGLVVLAIGATLMLVGAGGLILLADALNALIPSLQALADIGNSGSLLTGLAGGIVAMMGAELVSGAGYGWLKDKFAPALMTIALAMQQLPLNAGKELLILAMGVQEFANAALLIKLFNSTDIFAALAIMDHIIQMLPVFAMAVNIAMVMLNASIMTELTKLPNLITECCVEIGKALETGLTNAKDTAVRLVSELSGAIEPAFRDGVPWHSPIPWLDDFEFDFNGQLEEIFGNSDWLASATSSFAENGIHIPLVTSLTATEGDVKSICERIKMYIADVVMLTSSIESRHKEALKNNKEYEKEYRKTMAEAYAHAKQEKKLLDEMTTISEEERAVRLRRIDRERRNTINQFKVDHADMQDLLSKTNLLSEEYTEVTEEATEATLDFSDSLDEISGGGGGGGSAGKAKEAIEETTDALAEFIEKTKQAVENGLSIFDEFEKKTELTGKKLLENMRSQITGVAEWAGKLQLLAHRGIDQGLLAELSQLGPAGYEKVNAFTQMTAEELAEANQLWQTSLVLPDAITSQLADAWQVSGQMMVSGLTLGLQQDEPAATQITATSEKLLGLFNTAWGIASPSEVMRQRGIFIMQGLHRGLRGQEPLIMTYWRAFGNRLNTLTKEIMNKIIETIQNSAIKIRQEAVNAGRALGDGFKDGIMEKVGEVVDAAKALAEQALTAVKNALDMASPSKETFKIGRFFDEGLANGIKEHGFLTERAAADVGNNTLLGIQEALQYFNNYINDEAPVIRPVLDLTGVMEEAKKLDSTFNTNAKLGLAGMYDTAGNPINGQAVVNNFTQNNYSPKALSRFDIYRQTKNQLSWPGRTMYSYNG